MTMMDGDLEREQEPWWHRPGPWRCKCGRWFHRLDHLDLTELDGFSEQETCLCETCFEELVAEHARDDAIGRAELVAFTPDWPGASVGTASYFSEETGGYTERIAVSGLNRQEGEDDDDTEPGR